jgi:hypothetical protein
VLVLIEDGAAAQMTRSCSWSWRPQGHRALVIRTQNMFQPLGAGTFADALRYVTANSVTMPWMKCGGPWPFGFSFLEPTEMKHTIA